MGTRIIITGRVGSIRPTRINLPRPDVTAERSMQQSECAFDTLAEPE